MSTLSKETSWRSYRVLRRAEENKFHSHVSPSRARPAYRTRLLNGLQDPPIRRGQSRPQDQSADSPRVQAQDQGNLRSARRDVPKAGRSLGVSSGVFSVVFSPGPGGAAACDAGWQTRCLNAGDGRSTWTGTLFSNSIIRHDRCGSEAVISPLYPSSRLLVPEELLLLRPGLPHGAWRRPACVRGDGGRRANRKWILHLHQYDDITCRASMSPHTFGLKEMAPPTRLREPAQAEPITAAPGRRRRSPPSSSPMAEVKENLNSSKVEKAVSSLDQVASSWEDGPYVFHRPHQRRQQGAGRGLEHDTF
ncbi:unnamed protein product [Gadus morhua 'NCC']